MIIVVADALRRDRLGLYGHLAPTTPFLDRMAADCTVFDDALAQASQTFNSTASLLTSRIFPYIGPNTRYEGIPGVPEATQRAHASEPYLLDENLALPEVLRSAGYVTVGIFTNPHHHPTSGFWQGFDEAVFLPFAQAPINYAPAPEVRERFLEWYDRERPAAPYFAYLHFMDPHDPQTPPQALREVFVRKRGRDGLFFNGKPKGKRIPNGRDLAYMLALYDASIRYLDDNLRELWGELERRGASSNTVFILTADHGDEYMDHGGLGHGLTLELEQLEIPMLVCPPPRPSRFARHRAGRVRGLVRNLDLAPTVLELAGAPVPTEFEGVSLVPWLRDPDLDAGHPSASVAWVAQLRSWTTPAWHFWRDRSSELQRLRSRRGGPGSDVLSSRADIGELFSRRLEDVESRHRQADEVARRLVDAGLEPIPVGPTPEVVEQLRALGYLNEE